MSMKTSGDVSTYGTCQTGASTTATIGGVPKGTTSPLSVLSNRWNTETHTSYRTYRTQSDWKTFFCLDLFKEALSTCSMRSISAVLLTSN